MVFANINLGIGVDVDPSSSINNVTIGDNVKIAKRCSIYGSEKNPVVIGKGSYVGMNSIINGYADQIIIGNNVSIAQNVNIMVDSGPNASDKLQRLFPIVKGPVAIGDHCWLGTSSIIMPGVNLGQYCIVGANSFVKESFPSYSIIGGNPARLIRMMTHEEIDKLEEYYTITDAEDSFSQP